MALQVSTTNGGTVADATSHTDLMDKLIDFLTGVTAGNPILAVGDRWTVLKDDTASVPGERFVYLQGPGYILNSSNVNPHVNVRIYDSGLTARNWEIKGAIGFDTLQDFNNQPGGSPNSTYFTLQDSLAMPFWFFASARRFMIIAKIGGATYPACYGGFYLPYATPEEFPFPLFIGGNAESETREWNTQNFTVGNFYDGIAANSLDSADCSALVRNRDGNWNPVFRQTDSTSGVRGTSNDDFGNVWPWAENSTTFYGLNLVNGFVSTFYPVLPTVLYNTDGEGDILGELDGVFFCPGIGNSAESTVTDGGDVYLVINNVYRTNEANACFLQA